MIKKLLPILVIFGLVLPNFAFFQIKAPETLEEARKMGEEVGKKTLEKGPGIIEKIWRKEVLPIWKRMWEWFGEVWNSYIGQNVKLFWKKILNLLRKEIEKRKPIIKEELKKEKNELKKELPRVGKSFWEKFKELLRK